MSGPLSDIIVADFSRVLAGPYATMLLGDMGARVIKIERPGSGDDTRQWGPPYGKDGTATYFSGVNRNKWSIALDLTAADDREIATDVIRAADVMVENFKPGTLDRLGLGIAECQRINPRLISCSITGFGPDADLPGYDLLVQAMGGLMSITGMQEPTKVGVALVDVLTGLHAVSGVLAALHERDRTGRGQHIEVNLLASLLSGMVNQSAAFVQGGVVPGRMGNAHPSIAPYEVFQTADHPMVLAVGNDAQFRSLCRVIDRIDVATDERFATNANRVTHRDVLVPMINAALQTHSAAHWEGELGAVGIPCGRIHGIDEAFELAAELGLDPILERGGHREVAHPITYSDFGVNYDTAAPQLDQDRQRVLALLSDRLKP